VSFLNIPKIVPRYGLLAAMLVLAAATTTSCIGARMGNSWPALSTYGDQQNILVAYNDKVALIDTSKNGQPVQLRDADGNVQVNADGEISTWQITGDSSNKSVFYSSPILIDADTMLVVDYEGRIFLVNPQTSDIRRSSQVFEGQVNSGSGCVGDCVVANPVLDNGVLYVSLSNNDIAAVDIETLEVKWRFSTERGVWAKPLIDGDTLYVASMDHHLYAIDTLTHEAIWSVDLGGALAADPVLYKGSLYIGGLSRKLYRISPSDGTVLDEYETKNWVWSTPVIIDDVLYTTDLGGYVYALDISNGFEELWKTQAATKGIRPGPIVTDDSIIVGSRDGFVYWLERGNGASRFKVEVGAEILSDMLIVRPTETLDLSEPLIIVSTVDKNRLVVALPLDGGESVWKYPR
jgi:outer membrane protein assembly factor BamB